MKGQLAGLEVAADQQQVAGLPVASCAHAYQRAPLEPIPAERTSQRRASFSRRVTASAQVSVTPARQREVEAGWDPQHITLAAAFQELPQLRAVAVDLVPGRRNPA